jgi:phenylacetate-CoA ligase
MSADPPATAWRIRGVVPGTVWPGVPGPGAATALALLQQLEQTQWLAPEALQALQLGQLGALLGHAWKTVPWYRERWQDRFDPAAPVTRESLARLPLLTRADLRDQFAALASSACPPAHGEVKTQRTSGSTGAPVAFLTTAYTTLWWKVFTLRDHLWHRRDLAQKLAVVRHGSTPGKAPNWGAATAGIIATGPAVGHSLRADLDELLDWLAAERPAYFSSHPSLLASLARRAIERNVMLPELREVRTLAEALGPEVRELCRRAWDVPLTDVYSSTDAGYIALQCPLHPHYHVQSEGALVEVLDEQGAPCAPGAIGRVVVTTLQNFAMPLIRYDIGDYAEVGPPCPCGRGLPVLTRILGRVRNLLTTADGRSYWPEFGMIGISDVLPIRQFQFVQRAPGVVEGRIVAAPALDAAQEQQLRERVLSRLPPGVELSITCVDRIERSASGKFEDFVSELPGTTLQIP